MRITHITFNFSFRNKSCYGINNNNINGAVAVAAFSGACTLVGALMADLFAAALDPRIKMS